MSERDDWLEWSRERDARIGAEDGPLSLTALHWLTETPTAYPPVPGLWQADAGSVVVTAVAADGLSVDGEAITGTVAIDPAPDVRGSFAGQIVEVIRRSGAVAIRVRDPEAPARRAFTSLPRFDFNPDWRLRGRFEPYPQARMRVVGSVVEDVSHQTTTLGEIVFEVAGRSHRLVVFGDQAEDDRWVLFRDATCGVATPPARSLPIPAPDDNGEVTVDFNRSGNLPCAYNDYSTCPLPLPENRLGIEVTAGERLPV